MFGRGGWLLGLGLGERVEGVMFGRYYETSVRVKG